MNYQEYLKGAWWCWPRPQEHPKEKERLLRGIWRDSYSLTCDDRKLCMTIRPVYRENAEFVQTIYEANQRFGDWVTVEQAYGARYVKRQRQDGRTYNYQLLLVDRKGTRNNYSYMVSDDGIRFLRGELALPREFVVFCAKMFAFSNDTIMVNEAFARGFSHKPFSRKCASQFYVI